MIRKQDDFYDAINAEWAETAVIPTDKARTGGFSDLADEIEELMLKTTTDWQAGKDVPTEQLLSNFVKLHHLASDWETREKNGTAPVTFMIEMFKNIDSWSEFVDMMADLEEAGLPNAFPFGIAPDFKDAQMNVLWADALGTILPDTTYYEEGHEKGPELLLKWRETQTTLLEKFDFSAEDIQDLLDKAIAYDARIAKYVLSNEESAEYAKLYHPYDWQDFIKLVPELPLTQMMVQLIGEEPDKVIVPEERFWQHASEFYSEEAWPLLKATLILGAVNTYTGYLTDEIRILSGAYGRHLSGTPEAISREKSAYYLASRPYSQALGLWYAHKFFSPEAKADVEHQVAVMIDVYKNRLANIDWLAPETRAKAQVKLDAISAHIGYPEKLPARYYEKVIQDDDNLVSVASRFRRQEIAYHWSKWHQPVDRTEWHMPAHQVNAYYDPQQNQIVFPAAILQAPFYSLEQSSSANYGGIGTVIAHEISHAFDTNGASFDENGSLNNWWTDEDYAAFKVKTDKVVDQFEGLESYGAKVNGKLTVSENVADLGGVAAALEATEREEDADLIAFFNNWATIWRMKARPEYMQLLVASDVHAPAKLRTNVTMSNFEEFYTTYEVQPTDGMYRAPEDRVLIW